MPTMKIYVNNILLTQTIEKSNCVKYSDQTVKLIAIFIKDSRNNIMEKVASFAQIYFLHKGF